MATTGTTEAKEAALPQWRTITISQRQPDPPGTVEVSPKAGRVLFQNQDPVEYRIRLWKLGTDPNLGIDILLPATGNVIVVIKQDDEFSYSVMDVSSLDRTSTNGPIKN